MKITTAKYINARVLKASVLAAKPFYRPPGFTLDVDEALIGEEIDGNAVWYHCVDDNCYYWSGGILEVEFEIPQLSIGALTAQQVDILLKEAKQYFLKKYQYIEGFTGIGVAEKVVAGQSSPHIGLTFHTSNKSNQAKITIPKTLYYKGFGISTDVIPAAVASFEVETNRLADSVSKENDLIDYGTCGLIALGTTPQNSGTYLITNYHVVASDLIASEQYIFNQFTHGYRPCVVPSWKTSQNPINVVGHVFSGAFDQYYDIACIQLHAPSTFSNSTPSGTVLNTTLDIFANSGYHQQAVVIHGTESKDSVSKIISTNQSKIFEMPNGTKYLKENMIQMTKASVFGDSGAAVSMNGDVIGILIGSDADYSYAIPILRILVHFKLKLQ